MSNASHVLNRPQLDSSRIAANTGALAINAMLLLLLLAPMARPIIDAARHEEVITLIPRMEPRRIEPPRVPVVPSTPRQPVSVEPKPQTQQSVATTPDPVVVSEAAGELAELPPMDIGPATEPTDIAPPMEPVSGAQLQYIAAPPPSYPRKALQRGLTGTVMLEVLVDIDGRPLEVRISRSSGHRELDDAARRQVLGRWRFLPAMQNGQPVQAIGVVPVDFKLDI